ncbi:MAG: hypothetical protein BWY95_02638 [Bacteroidetes bacterium ADurb.BinA104]|nr:MAG: hypothetical protein BWY95_02638 [Bacteroidetes bacterium ADurb.BinA104]
MFRIDGNYRGFVFHGQRGDKFTGNYKSLLIGQSYYLTGFYSFNGRTQTGKPDHRGQYNIYRLGVYNLIYGITARIDLNREF